MIYVTVSNLVCALLLIVLFVKHLRLKKTSTTTITDLQQKFEEELREVDVAENQLREGLMADNKKIESLTKEISDLKKEKEDLLRETAEARKEKEDELRLRLETEKQIVLALQKTEDVQKRMHDWKAAQDAAMKDSQETIIKVGEDLYTKLTASHQVEVETNKNLIEKVTELLRKTAASAAPKSAPATAEEKTSAQPKISTASSTSAPEDVAKKLALDLVQSMKDSNHIEGEKYFLPSSFEATKAKMFFCEAAFLQGDNLSIFDFKACNFLEEYLNATDKVAAASRLTQKLDKYIAYLGNPKYHDSILRALATTSAKFNKTTITAILPAARDLEVLKEIGYYEKLSQTAAAILSFDEVLDLTL